MERQLSLIGTWKRKQLEQGGLGEQLQAQCEELQAVSWHYERREVEDLLLLQLLQTQPWQR